jgi:uncharacterized SAM-binding protein YcdF (DUF218 family)
MATPASPAAGTPRDVLPPSPVNPLLAHLKDTWRLASPPFMLGVLAIGVVLLFNRRTMMWGRRWLATVLLGYWLLSLPFASLMLSKPLTYEHDQRLASAAEARGAQAVVVLGGGIMSYVADDIGHDDLQISALRVLEGVRVYRLLGDPLLIVSGGNTQRLSPSRPEAEAFRRAAINLGVPPERIVVDDVSFTTREQAHTIKAMLAERHIDRFVLVTSPTHMGRSLAIFRAVGLGPVPSASRLRSRQDRDVWTLMPDRKALIVSDAAIYEYIAWAYYRARGWIK